MSRPVSETVAQATLDRLERREWEPRHRPAGPAYPSIDVFGFKVNPADTTKAKFPSVRFQGTDAQYQVVLDKANATTVRKSYQRRDKLEVRIHKLEVKLRQMETLKIKEIERRIRILETITQYGGATNDGND